MTSMQKKGQAGGSEARAYVLRAGAERIEIPKELEGLPTKIVQAIPNPPEEPPGWAVPETVIARLGVPNALQTQVLNCLPLAYRQRRPAGRK